MSTTNTDAHDLNAVERGGVIREDVMEKIWLIDKFPLPLTDLLSNATGKNPFKEFTTDELGESDENNKSIDGEDIDQDDSELGERAGNFHQIAVKGIKISKRANAVDSVGRIGTLSYQVSRGQQRLRRDVESQMGTHQASIQGSSTVASQSAGIGAWIKTNAIGGVGFNAGGFNPATGVIDAPTPGEAAAITETDIRDVAQAVYEEGGNTFCIMSTPTVIRIISEYLFSEQARVATMTNQNASGDEPMKAYGSSNVFITDFGQVLMLKDNRLQKPDDIGVASAYFLDPEKLFQSFITGYQTETLSKTGLSEKRLISVDYSLIVTNEKSQGSILAIDETLPMAP